jgi:hypothetical protein
MMAEQPKATGTRENIQEQLGCTGGLQKPADEPPPVTLAEAGIDKNFANRARKAAALPDEQLEAQLL